MVNEPAVLIALIVAGLAFSVATPTRVILLLWAALLPIYAVGNVDPRLFDVMRYSLAFVIFIRHPKVDVPQREAVGRWAVLVFVMGALIAISGKMGGDETAWAFGYTASISAVAAWFVVSRKMDLIHVYAGFLFGATLSAGAICFQAIGIDGLAPQRDVGFSRAAGLSTSAVLVSFELAIAIVFGVYLLRRPTKHRLIVTLAIVVCLAGLLISGGRGGLAGLALALLLAARWRRLGIKALLFGLSAIGAVLWFAGKSGFALNTFERLESAGAGTDITSGRANALPLAWDAALREPFAGIGLSDFVAQHGVLPHVSPLTMAVAGGAVPGVIAFWLVSRTFWMSVARRVHEPVFLLGGVVTAWNLLEPNGTLAGLTGVTLQLMVARAYAGSEGHPKALAPVQSAELQGQVAGRAQSASRPNRI